MFGNLYTCAPLHLASSIHSPDTRTVVEAYPNILFSAQKKYRFSMTKPDNFKFD